MHVSCMWVNIIKLYIICRAMLLNGPGLIIILILTSGCGMVAYAHFKDCDPLKSGVIHATDQVFTETKMHISNVIFLKKQLILSPLNQLVSRLNELR